MKSISFILHLKHSFDISTTIKLFHHLIVKCISRYHFQNTKHGLRQNALIRIKSRQIDKKTGIYLFGFIEVRKKFDA